MTSKRQETVKLSDLTLLDKNPRRHTQKQIEEMTKSVNLFGQYRPLVIDEDGVILAGNGLYIALSNMGWETAEAYRMIGLSDSDRTKLILSDNRIGDMSDTDFAVLEEIIGDLNDFEVPGYDPETLRGILMTVDVAAEEAAQYGVLDQEDRDRLTRNHDRLEAETARATTPQPPQGDPGTAPAPTAPPAPGPVPTAGEGGSGLCPTCRRPW